MKLPTLVEVLKERKRIYKRFEEHGPNPNPHTQTKPRHGRAGEIHWICNTHISKKLTNGGT